DAQGRQVVRMEERGGPALSTARAGRLRERRVEERARWSRHQAERLGDRGVVDHVEVVRQRRHLLPASSEALPVALEVKAAVGGRESVQEVRRLEWQRAVLT